MKRNILLLLIMGFIKTAAAQDAAEIGWINTHAVPIKTVYAGSGFDDLAALDAFIGDTRIVAMGECTHGSSEIFSMKHRMLEFLVKKKGFTIFSIEANMPEAYALNQYIMYGKGDPKELLAGMYFWTWNTQEVLDMILWMKQYNDTAAAKIMFTGFDMQFTPVASGIVKDYLQKNLPGLLPVLNHYDSLCKANIRNKDYKKALYPALKDDAALLVKNMNELKHLPGDTSFAWAYQNTVILSQYAAGLNDGTARDRFMAKNLQWIADGNPGAKIMVWAHNGHVKKDKNKWGNVSMGTYLKKALGNQYMAIGFSTEEGTYTAKNTDRKNVADSGNVLTASKGKDCENLFKRADADNFFIGFKGVDENTKGAEWLYKNMNLRMLGALVNDKFQFFQSVPAQDYDGIIFLKHTNSSKCFSVNKSTGAGGEK